MPEEFLANLPWLFIGMLSAIATLVIATPTIEEE
jgi:hypothetical protein